MRKAKTILMAAVLLMGLAAGRVSAQAATADEQIQKLIEVLKSDAPLEKKHAACRELSLLDAKEAVPVAAGMLADEKLNQSARIILEVVTDPSAGDALRDAMGKLKESQLVGVINSVGARRDEKAVEALSKCLADTDAQVACAAAAALGRINTEPAAEELKKALATAPAPVKPAVCEGLLSCADSALARHSNEWAGMIYQQLRDPQCPGHIRMAALRGQLLAIGSSAAPKVAELLKAQDAASFNIGLLVSRELPGTEMIQAAAAELPKLPADRQAPLIGAISARADAGGTTPAIVALAKGGEAAVRLAAIRALVQIADPAALPALVELAGSQGEAAAAAQTALASFPGPQADAAIAGLLAKPEPAARALGVALTGQRRGDSLANVSKMLGDADGSVRAAALRVLGEQGGADAVPAILALVAKADTADLPGAESALGAIFSRPGNAEPCTDPLLASLGQSKDAARLALLRTTRALATPKALAAVRSAAGDADAAAKEVAVRLLCEWNNTEAMPDLAELAKSSADAKTKVLALRGYTRLMQSPQLPADQKLAAAKTALSLATEDEARKGALAALGAVPSADALALVTPLLDGNLKEEASLAAVAIGEKIAGSAPAAVAPAMEKVIKATSNQQVSQRAKAALDAAKAAQK